MSAAECQPMAYYLFISLKPHFNSDVFGWLYKINMYVKKNYIYTPVLCRKQMRTHPRFEAISLWTWINNYAGSKTINGSPALNINRLSVIYTVRFEPVGVNSWWYPKFCRINRNRRKFQKCTFKCQMINYGAFDWRKLTLIAAKYLMHFIFICFHLYLFCCIF